MSKSFFRASTRLFLTTALILGGTLSLLKSVLAAPTPPGTVIDNSATGSFDGVISGTTSTVTSNTVTFTVLEVAGITVTPDSTREATVVEAGVNAGSYQGVDGINTNDLVYFDFVITNVGNDPTAFFIPALPSSVTGATFSAASPIQIIAVDPDGASGGTAPTPLSFNVTTAGNTLTLLGATNGYIPPQGTVTVRVPVKVTATIIGNPISVVLGNTPPNDNSPNTQNQIYSASGNDVYTVDLANGTATPVQAGYTGTTPEANSPATPEKEASALSTVNLVAAYQLKGFKSVALTTDVGNDNDVNQGDTVTWTVTYVNTGTGDITNLQLTDNLAASGTTFAGPLAIATNPNLLANGNPTANIGYNGNAQTNLFSSAIALKPGEVVTVSIPVTINSGGTIPRTEQDQASATGNKNGGVAITAVLTDNVDNIPAETLPTNVTVPAGSITQTENIGSINPTTAQIVGVVTNRDYGDAPDTGTGIGNYQTTFSDGGPSQAVSPTIRLGIAVDGDTGTLQNTNANADDNDGIDDEDSVTTLPSFSTKSGLTYSVSTKVTNSSGANTYLRGYVDFNKDGDFNDLNEQSSATVTVPSSGTNPQTVQLQFTSPSGLTAGTTYARLRLSSVQSDAESPIGAASNPGEVEDYAVTINQFGTQPVLSCATKNGTLVWGNAAADPNYYKYKTPGTLAPAIYVNISDALDLKLSFAGSTGLLTNSTSLDETNAPTDTDLAILTGTELFSGGRSPAEPSLNLNISGTRNSFVTTKVEFLDGTTAVVLENINFTIFDVDRFGNSWQDRVVVRGYNGATQVSPSLFINPSTASGNPGHQFYNGATNDVIATANQTPNTGMGSEAGNVGVTFTEPITGFEIDYYNGPDAKSSSDGHGIGLVGSIQLCGPPYDFGDALDTYGTDITAANSGTDQVGPSHIINTNLKIGATLPDSENNALGTLDGTGDDTTGIDDEDIVAISGLTTDLNTYTLNVPVTNNTTGNATLVGWIDFDRNNTFEADEGVTVTVSSGATSINLTWNNIGTTGPNIQAGLTYARFRLTKDTITTSNWGGPLGGGEVEDLTLTISPPATTAPELILVKRITAKVSDGVVTNYTAYQDDGSTTKDNNGFWPGYASGNGSNTFTVGALTAEASPKDIVEYTIYFLNTGGSSANNVKICDPLSQYLTYIPNSYDANAADSDGGGTTNLGIQLNFSGTKYMTGLGTDAPDRGAFVGANIAPAGCVSPDDLLAMEASDNPNGTVTVNLTGIQPATGIGTPNTAFGFIRFRTTVN